ncbi:hypothetical protein HAX54_035345, partial [Datura stramonium]|nr:hypothetical protein [Datura stramonium]
DSMLNHLMMFPKTLWGVSPVYTSRHSLDQEVGECFYRDYTAKDLIANVHQKGGKTT